ncbi:ATP-dependent endonuclease [Bordetella sp. LUAb4]|uniref:ATP-dependent nuclease n=1 Tax=Bordetella sp. LUAb4 TaxID=2843195 RepID=UPI001E431218|nr:AAA family ATPase [Bordetella sp. LUAb4]
MQIRQIQVSNFRGISTLDWKPGHTFCCLIGAGDAGKSTLLDAAEAALSSRWFSFSESDFFACDTTQSIQVEVTVGELSRTLKSDDRLGLYIRGWTAESCVRDEPEDDDEPVLTVRLTVDATMEPVWQLICERFEDPRTLSNRDRALFGLLRLAGDDARHLAWGQGSVLARLAGDTSEAATRLAEAYRIARASANLGGIESFADAARLAEGFAKGMGAYVAGAYGPGLELGRAGLTSGSVALHDGSVPLRLAGLGTRRLATLAIQKSAISEGAIVLVDEIEHGLEPHRIIGAISQLKADAAAAIETGQPVGQVLMTTHSDVALGEVDAASIHVVQIEYPARNITIAQPEVPITVKKLLKFFPRALFARRILLTEGYTELGLLLGLREKWPPLHAGKPIEQQGAAIADGNGDEAPTLALILAKLGYAVALYRDSDQAIAPATIGQLNDARVPIFQYDGEINTEQAIMGAATPAQMQELLVYARAEKGEDSINDQLLPKLTDLTIATLREPFPIWALDSALDDNELAGVVAMVASDRKWFKDLRVGRGLAPLVWSITRSNPRSTLAATLAQVEAWLYA